MQKLRLSQFRVNDQTDLRFWTTTCFLVLRRSLKGAKGHDWHETTKLQVRSGISSFAVRVDVGWLSADSCPRSSATGFQYLHFRAHHHDGLEGGNPAGNS